MEGSESKACPFCGDWASVLIVDHDHNEALCSGCAARARLSAWNRRPLEEALTAQLRQVEGERDRYRAALEGIAQVSDSFVSDGTMRSGSHGVYSEIAREALRKEGKP